MFYMVRLHTHTHTHTQTHTHTETLGWPDVRLCAGLYGF